MKVNNPYIDRGIKFSNQGILTLVQTYMTEGIPMNNNNQDQQSKAEVQTTPLNKLPVPGEDDTEFSAEEAADVFEQNESANEE